MERFEELKQELLKRAKDADACKEQYARAYRAQTLAQLMLVCRDNFYWACDNNVLDVDIIRLYHDEFASGSIYANENVVTGYLLCNNATVFVWGNTIVDASNNAVVNAYDNARVEAWDHVTVNAYDNAVVNAYGSSTVSANGCNVRVEAYDTTYITSFWPIETKLLGNAICMIRGNNTIKYANLDMKFELVE